MKRLVPLLCVALLATLVLAPTAQAGFGLSEFDVVFKEADGSTASQAGSHPYEMTTSLHFLSTPTGEGGETLEEAVKDILVSQVPGFVGNPTAVGRCGTADFLSQVRIQLPGEGGIDVPDCPDSSAVGVVSVKLANKQTSQPLYAAVYNLEPPPGAAAKLGFSITGVPVMLELGVSQSPPYTVFGGPTNISQVLEVVASTLTIWGVPADPGHDSLRGHCISPSTGASLGKCVANSTEVPFLTLPRSCEGPLATRYTIDSWQNPGVFLEGQALTHDAAGNPQGMSGCGKLQFGPEVSVRATSTAAESASGLEIELEVTDEGLLNPDGTAEADIRATRFAFPRGMTANPSAAEGLGVCTLAQYEAASLALGGCPEASKLGTIEVETPVLENHTIKGAVYLGAPDDAAAAGSENPFDSLLATYIALRDPELGIFVKLAAEVETDPASGRLTASVQDLPPFPLSRVSLRLRSGPRAPLITPPTCGTYATQAALTPSSGAAARLSAPSFAIASGPGGAPCPPGGVPPFDPGFEAGSRSNAAASFSPFDLRITRADGEQDLTKLSAQLPPGLLGKLAGVGSCPDIAIAAAKAKTGRTELASPSCPAASRIGRTLAGAGVGTALTYVPGSLYLAGPYRGAPLSVVSITPAVAGPFDVGTVVVRLGLGLDPRTAQVEVDGAASDPIPHILRGIPLKVRDLRVHVERESFTLNPTSCEEHATEATLFGSHLDVFSAADDVPVSRRARFQAADCQSLGFKPRLSLRLKGGTKRGAHPALHAVYRPRPGNANLEGMQVRLPRSAFLDQDHIRTICTRVQFAAERCPKGARYGYIRAWTPLLDEPLQGPVWLRSSNHDLPDLVFDLRGLVDVEVATRIDSFKGGIRATIASAPDAPISKVILRMQGAKKGLIVNSRDLCAGKNRAKVAMRGHNGKRSRGRPRVRARC